MEQEIKEASKEEEDIIRRNAKRSNSNPALLDQINEEENLINNI